jgi:hypothetical protein
MSATKEKFVLRGKHLDTWRFEPHWDGKKLTYAWMKIKSELIEGPKPNVKFSSPHELPEIYRILPDQSNITWGDGGNADLLFPVYCRDNLFSKNNSLPSELSRLLLDLDAKRKDVQGHDSPVHDIIDPDFAPCLLESPMPPLELSRDQQRIERALDVEFNAKDDWKNTRRGYQWIPTLFRISSSGKVTICSRIHNLPPLDANAKLYTLIRKVFEAMVPMWKQVRVIPEYGNCELKVIVKAQAYCLSPGSSYSGRWHVEGLTEGILAAGVYYTRIDSCLSGGNLKFRPSSIPQPKFEFEKTAEVSLQEGAAAVFSNELPHRFRKIRNNSTSEDGWRVFVNFFVISPGDPIKSTLDIPFRGMIVTLLKKASSEAKCPLPDAIIQLILGFIPDVWASNVVAMKFRKLARQAMKEYTSGWGWLHWGNFGRIDFVQAIDNQGKLQHTESDTC